MRYRVQVSDDSAYRRVEEYADEACGRDAVKVKLPERRILSIEGLSDSAIEELRRLGANVEPEFQWDLESDDRFSIG